jgi:deazaflavin-dependent oxidoreductase (nitroreductase family)
VKIVRSIRPPAGLTRSMFRLPILVSRLGLGWLFARRLLLLNHIGCVTGKPRQTILEVVKHDANDDSYVVASGWGPDAAWYRNILRDPHVAIQVGRCTSHMTAVSLSQDERAEIFSRYAARRRRLARYMLPRVMGVSVNGSRHRLSRGEPTNALCSVRSPLSQSRSGAL